MTKKLIAVMMPLFLSFSLVTLAFNTPLLEVKGTTSDHEPSLMGTQWQSATGWNRTYGGTSYDYASSVIQTSDGGYAVAGYTYSYGAGYSDFWLVKTDAAGSVQWNRTYGGARSDDAQSVVQTSDGGYVLAGFTFSYGAGIRDFYLVKTDSSGTALWNRTYGGASYDYAQSVVQTNDGGYAVAGITSSYGAGNYDFWLVKTDGSGLMQWNRTYGGTGIDQAYSAIQTSDGGYALAGYTTSYGGSDFWLVKTDGSGLMQWDRTYGGAGGGAGGSGDFAFSVVQSSDGGYAVAGSTNPVGTPVGRDLWLVKTDGSGGVQWSKTHGGTSDDCANSVIQTSDEGFAVAGYTYSYGAGDGDFWLVKLTPRTIHIRADGSVDPSSAPILRNGSTYTLMEDITCLTNGILIETDSITLDGNDYTVQGSGGGYGIILRSGVRIQNLSIRSFYYGVTSNLTSHSAITQNKLRDNYYGVWLYGSNSTISGNAISGSQFGVNLLFSSSVNVSDNVVADNWIGICLNGTKNSILSRNLLTGNTNVGIGLRASSDDNLIIENNIANNNETGISLAQYASGNYFYHNNFVNNPMQIGYGDNTTLNTWDNGYPSGGNYWSNYNGTDSYSGPYQNVTGSDKIGDTPHTLDANNTDNYPLMGAWTPTGQNIIVSLPNLVTIIFKNVTFQGIATVDATPTGPPAPTAYNIAGEYYDIRTTANYTDQITLEFWYNDTDLSKPVEENLRLKYWNESSNGWEDITTLVDTENNIIYGTTNHLSIFAVHSIDTNTDLSLDFQSATCAKTVVGRGLSATIDVTIANIGLASQTFDLNIFADSNLIGRQTVADLAPGEQRVINFIWQVPPNFPKDNYTLIAGNLTGWIIVAMVGDVSGIGTFPNTLPDGNVDIKDIAVIAKVFGVDYLNSKYVANYDITGPTVGLADGKIDIRDLATAAKNYGKIDP